MVTRDEVDSTRGRANALRLAMSGQLEDGLANTHLPEVLDLCVSCKACKAECPSSVDMARLKGEVMQHQYDRYGASWKDKMIGRSPELARRIAGSKATLVNTIQSFPLVKQAMMKMMGLDLRRDLPAYATRTWTKSIKQRKATTADPDIILLVDTYTQCHHPQSGIAAVQVLERLGKTVMLLDAGCCQRPRISHGFLREAAAKVKPGIQKILPWLEKNIPMAVLEPGCASAWTDDIPDLIADDHASALLKRIRPFEQILWDVLKEEKGVPSVIRPKTNEILVHGHCHQKSIYGMDAVRSIFTLWPEVKYTEIDSGCCGMAGSFGYEANHFDISKKMAERVLIPAIEDHPDALLVANGFSCRHQIADFAGREAMHIAQAFDIL
jgi:Fe-S oxidoreductase